MTTPRFTAHPWHGVSIGNRAPGVVTTFIEIVPTDTVKYEIDKDSGILKVDRPQKYSNVCPTPYGFVPRTFCDAQVAKLCETRTNRSSLIGDGDPLDICVLTERPIQHGNVLLQAIPVGGFRMIDKNEVDDKIVAVLEGDIAYGALADIQDCPKMLIDRLRHYFLTYKQAPDEVAHSVEIAEVYGRDAAWEVIRASQADYDARFGAK